MFTKLRNWVGKGLINWLNHERPVEGNPLCDFERIRYEIRPCDVLLIEGRSRVSDIIRSTTQSAWSHAALYIGRIHEIEDPKVRNLLSTHFQDTPDSQLLIEGMMGQGTIVSNITNYQYDHIRICRPRSLSRQDSQKVIAFLVHKLGTAYDVRHIFDLGRFLLPWTIMPRQFRSKLFEYRPGENTKTVCSSMIAEAFTSVQFPILPLIKNNNDENLEFIMRNPKLYTPRDFDYSPYFEIIKYPFIEIADYAGYRRLPWNKEGLISNDEMGVLPIAPEKREIEIEHKPSKPQATFLKKIREKLIQSQEKKDKPEKDQLP